MNKSGTRWLDPHQQQRWRSIQRGMMMLTDHLDRDLLSEADLSLNEYEVMVRLSEVPERRLRMSVLADQLVNSRSRLSHTVRPRAWSTGARRTATGAACNAC